ncbi:hypothetical protein [Corynebacterium faecium]|uniref:hypothetical protein n=1 Tax=Corynebacterium faecium TaxID=3016001 RepID=UPI0022B52FD6|nr:hypothetical protein [Corynebacterium faecium]
MNDVSMSPIKNSKRLGIACISALTLTLGSTVVVPANQESGLQKAEAQVPTAPNAVPKVETRQIGYENDRWRTNISFKTPGKMTGVEIEFLPKDSDTTLPDEATYEIRKYRSSTDYDTVDTVTGYASKGGDGWIRLNLDFRTVELLPAPSNPTETYEYVNIVALGDSSNYAVGKGVGGGTSVAATPRYQPGIDLNLQNDPGNRDPLFEGSKDKCIKNVEGTLTTGTTTWIAESFDATKPEKPRNPGRNRTVLQYRQDGLNDGEHFTPVPGKDPESSLGPGETDWVYNSLAYNSKDGYLYAVSQNRPNDDGTHPAGVLLRKLVLRPDGRSRLA